MYKPCDLLDAVGARWGRDPHERVWRRRATLKVVIVGQSCQSGGLVGSWLETDFGVASGTRGVDGVKKVFSMGGSQGQPQPHVQSCLKVTCGVPQR